jgi:hypothetical protein
VARYFFNVVDGRFLPDEEGTECAGMMAVREQAIATAGEILKDLAPSFPRGLEWQLHVSDESKLTVLKLKFSLEEPVHLTDFGLRQELQPGARDGTSAEGVVRALSGF